MGSASVLINVLIIIGILFGNILAASLRRATDYHKNGVEEKNENQAYNDDLPIWFKCVGCYKKNNTIIAVTESTETTIDEATDVNDIIMTVFADSESSNITVTEPNEIVMDEEKLNGDMKVPANAMETKLNVSSATISTSTKKPIGVPTSLDDRFLFKGPTNCAGQIINGHCRTNA